VAGGEPAGRAEAAAPTWHTTARRDQAPARHITPARRTGSAAAKVACGELLGAVRRFVAVTRTGGSGGEPGPASALDLASAAQRASAGGQRVVPACTTSSATAFTGRACPVE